MGGVCFPHPKNNESNDAKHINLGQRKKTNSEEIKLKKDENENENENESNNDDRDQSKIQTEPLHNSGNSSVQNNIVEVESSEPIEDIDYTKLSNGNGIHDSNNNSSDHSNILTNNHEIENLKKENYEEDKLQPEDDQQVIMVTKNENENLNENGNQNQNGNNNENLNENNNENENKFRNENQNHNEKPEWK